MFRTVADMVFKADILPTYAEFFEWQVSCTTPTFSVSVAGQILYQMEAIGTMEQKGCSLINCKTFKPTV